MPFNTNRIYRVTPDLISTCMRMAPRFCESREFHDDMFLYGIGYRFTGSGWWFKPFFAKRYTDQTYYTGDNGYVAGWVAVTTLCWAKGNSLFQLNEYEFDNDATMQRVMA